MVMVPYTEGKPDWT